MKKFAYLLLILPLFLFNSCTDDTPSSIKGTKWTYSISGKEALEMIGSEEIPEGASISFSITLDFKTSSSMDVISKATITYMGQTLPNETTQVGSYTYDSKTGKVDLTIDGLVETGTIEKNNLTIVSEGKTMVFVKK